MNTHPATPLLAVVGTDTGVGKTVVCAGLLHGLSRRGMKVAGFKPVETGIPDPHVETPKGAADWERLEQASGQTPGTALGVSFPLPAAPLAAARASGRKLSLVELEDKLIRLCYSHELVIVEGAGGLLVPLMDDLLWGDYLKRLVPQCLVVGRLGLGSINHTLLTLEALRGRGLQPLGVILCTTEPPGPETRYTPDLMSEFGNIAVFETIPWGLVGQAQVADHLSACGLLDLLDPHRKRPS